MMDTQIEISQYLFDLNGYLVIENVLSPGELAELNRLIDEQDLPPPDPKFPRFGSAAGAIRSTGPGYLDWGQAFANLMDHELILPILRFRLGDCFRLERLYGMYMREGMPLGGLHADYGASAPNSRTEAGSYHPVREFQANQGFMVAAWNLADTGPGKGGFCCIPGSHKSNYRIPQSIHQAHQDGPWTKIIEAPAGSVTLFTEALIHGTARWEAAYERRTLLFKYCVSNMSWGSKRVTVPEGYQLSARQTQLLADPGDPMTHFSSIFPNEQEG